FCPGSPPWVSRASSRRSRGRRISADSWSGFLPSPHSIRSRVQPNSTAVKARIRHRRSINYRLGETRARPATVGGHLAALWILSDNLGLVSAAQRSVSSAAEPIASRTGPAARPWPDGAAGGTRWQIEHYRAGTPRARSKPREATHARQEHSLRQGWQRRFDRAHGDARNRGAHAHRTQNRRVAC